MSVEGLRAPHVGRNVRRIREIKGIKQEALATELGLTQQSISNMEQSETIDEEKLQKVAKALGVTTEEIKSFSDELVFHNIVNDQGKVFNYIGKYEHDSMDKVVEMYERLIKEKDNVIEMQRHVIEMYQQKPDAS